jgi:hypothetical protein
MCSQQIFPLEPSAEVSHNRVDIIDEQALEDQKGQRLLIDSNSFETLNYLLGNLLQVVFLPMDLDECKAKIEKEISYRLKLASDSVVDED